MRWLRHLTAVFLLTLWLPATQHCGLEALGLLAAAGEDCCAGGIACEDDSCGAVEGGGFNSAAGEIKLPVPGESFVADTGFRLIPPPAARTFEPPGLRAAREWPAGRLPQWQFARRAARLPGAPSVAIA